MLQHFTKIRFLFNKLHVNEVGLKNQLYALTPQQQDHLKRFWVKETLEDYERPEVKLHFIVAGSISKFQSLSSLKNVSHYYITMEYKQQEFWNNLCKSYLGIISGMHKFDKVQQHMFPFLLVLLKLQDQRLLDNDAILRQCCELTINKIHMHLHNQPLINQTHFINAVAQFQIVNPLVYRSIKDSIQSSSLFGSNKQISHFDIVKFFMALSKLYDVDILRNATQLFNSYQVHSIIQQCKISYQFDNKSYIQLIYLLCHYRVHNENTIKHIGDIMPKIDIDQLRYVIKVIVKSQNSINLFPILMKLKTQLNQYCLNQQQNTSDSNKLFKCLLSLYSQSTALNGAQRNQLYEDINIHEQYIMNNIEKINDGESMLCILRMSQQFNQGNEMVRQLIAIKQSKSVELQFHELVEFLQLLIPFQKEYCIQITQVVKQIEQSISKQQQYSMYNRLNIGLNYQLAVCVEQLECVDMKQLSNYIQQDLINQYLLAESQKNRNKDTIKLAATQNYKYLNDFRSGGFDQILYEMAQSRGYQIQKESRVGLYLMDYRLFKANSQGGQIEQLQQHPTTIDYDDPLIDYKLNKDNIFIELDGINHFNAHMQYNTRTQNKHNLLNKWGINLKIIRLDDESQMEIRSLISKCLDSI